MPDKGMIPRATQYEQMLGNLVELLKHARRTAARSINAVMTATYWEIGRRIVEFEQRGKSRAGYGEALVDRLAEDLTSRFGRGFARSNLFQMRAFYFAYRDIVRTPSGQSVGAVSPRKVQTVSGQSAGLADLAEVAARFELSWSHYVRLLTLRSAEAREFYEAEALRGGWTVRQLERQIESQFYERTLLSRNKAAMLRKGEKPLPDDAVTPEEEIKDPCVLEFLGLKDEYSESQLEAALIARLEALLLELGGDFTFVGRQRRLRIDDEWYRVDLLFFHRRLRCLVIIDLKLGKFTHADAGQMNLYLSYASEHWTREGENPPVGIILCAAKGEALVHYATDNLLNKLLVREYLTALPDRKLLAAEIDKTRRRLEKRRAGTGHSPRGRNPTDDPRG
jgi:predicted nuclease of restriction endonuclease-like (RecB) superfamily